MAGVSHAYFVLCNAGEGEPPLIAIGIPPPTKKNDPPAAAVRTNDAPKRAMRVLFKTSNFEGFVTYKHDDL